MFVELTDTSDGSISFLTYPILLLLPRPLKIPYGILRFDILYFPPSIKQYYLYSGVSSYYKSFLYGFFLYYYTKCEKSDFS